MGYIPEVVIDAHVDAKTVLLKADIQAQDGELDAARDDIKKKSDAIAKLKEEARGFAELMIEMGERLDSLEERVIQLENKKTLMEKILGS